MKRKRNLLRSIVASILIFACFMPELAYAGVSPGSNITGDSTVIPPSSEIFALAPGILIMMSTVPNSHANNTKIKEKQKNWTAGSTWYDEVGCTVVDEYLKTYPDFMADPGNANAYEKGILIGRVVGNANINSFKNGPHRLMNQQGDLYPGIMKHVYLTGRGSCTDTYTNSTGLGLVSTKIKTDNLVDDFLRDGSPEKVNMSYINSYISSNKSTMDSAVTKFVAHFKDTGTLAAHLKSLMDMSKSEETTKQNLLNYLDLLVLLYYMSGNNSDNASVIETFLKGKNRDGSDEFAVIFFDSMFAYGNETTDLWYWMSFPINLKVADSQISLNGFGKDLTLSCNQGKDSLHQTNGNDFTSNSSKYMKEIWDKMQNLDGWKGAQSGAKLYRKQANIANMWFSKDQTSSSSWDFRTAFALMPTDIFGKQTGTVGFTYFSTAGIPLSAVKPEASGEIRLTIPEEQKSVKTSKDDGATFDIPYVISLKVEKTKQDAFEKLFAYAKEQNKKVKVTVKIVPVLDGAKDKLLNPDGNYWDTIKYDSDDIFPAPTISNSSPRHCTFVNEDMKWDGFKTYLDGTNNFSIIDTGVELDTSKVADKGSAYIQYRATCTVHIDGEDDIKFVSDGCEKPDEYTAADTWNVTWDPIPTPPLTPTPEPTVTPTPVPPEPKSFSSYTLPEPAYAEIKQGSYKNEEYEAMAGVPTTKNLYIGFGATEFILNMEGEYTFQEDACRHYQTTYTATKVYDGETDCVYSCPGTHSCTTYKNGCGICKTCNNEKEEHTHSDACYELDAEGNRGALTCTKEEHTHTLCNSGTYEENQSCSSGPITLKSTCSCGKKSDSKTFTPKWGEGYSVCNANGNTHYTGMGCEVTHADAKGSTNQAHVYTIKYTTKAEQEIDMFWYMDIQKLELWRVNNFWLDATPGLFTSSKYSLPLTLGYKYFYDQGEYSNHNGRIWFSTSLGSAGNYGDTDTSKTDSTVQKPAAAATAASTWTNQQYNKNVVATIVSDYLLLNTTHGAQVPLWYTYNSKSTKLLKENVEFSDGTADQELNPEMEKIEFDEGVTSFDKAWTNNSLSAAGWSMQGIVRDGYTGKYAEVNGKYDYTNKYKIINSIPSFIEAHKAHIPYVSVDWEATSKPEAFRSVNNIDIIDTTPNGQKDVGTAMLKAEKTIDYGGGTSGPKHDDYEAGIEVGYCAGQGSINDIVIHNPVSTQYAIVIPNDSALDLRTTASIEDGADPAGETVGCPMDSSCGFMTFNCKVPFEPHVASCWSEVKCGMNHVGGLNSHEHTDACNATPFTLHVHTDSCYSTSASTTHHHTGSAAEGTGCYAGGTYHTSGTCGASFVGNSITENNAPYTCSTCGNTVYSGRIYKYCANGHKVLICEGSGGCACYAGYTWNIPSSVCNKTVSAYYELACGYTEGQEVPGTKTLICTKTYEYPMAEHVHNDSCYTGGTPIVHHHSSSCGSTYHPAVTCNGSLVSNGTYTTSCWTCGGTMIVTRGKCSSCGYSSYWISMSCDTCSYSTTVATSCVQTLSYAWTEYFCGYYEGQQIGTADKTLVCTKVHEDYYADYTLTFPVRYSTYKVEGLNGDKTSVTFNPSHRLAVVKHTTGADTTHYHLWDETAGYCLSCGTTTAKTVIKSNLELNDFMGGCTEVLNKHTCTSACSTIYKRVLTCTNPHHYDSLGMPDVNDLKNHYPYGDLRCWDPCGNAENHKPSKVKVGDTEVSLSDVFINLDHEFKIYFPDVGDFAGMTTLQGIESCTLVRGKGYTNNMGTSSWLKSKSVRFPVDVVWHIGKADAKTFKANTDIDLTALSYDAGTPGYYTFYCTLSSHEMNNGTVTFKASAINDEYDVMENSSERNLERNTKTLAAKHDAVRSQYIDVIGFIGSLTINDTGDWRYANLFKQELNTSVSGWLVKNIMPKVNTLITNKVVTDPLDVRQNTVTTSTKWYWDTYGTLWNSNGGKSYFENPKLPLTMADQNVSAIKNMQMLAGYKLFMDAETVGEYYGENRSESGTHQDSGLVYNMQITPRYWELNLTTGEWKPVDIYYSVNGSYKLLNKFNYQEDNPIKASDYYFYLDWNEESIRRNFASQKRDSSDSKCVTEKEVGDSVAEWMSPSDMPYAAVRLPGGRVSIGTTARLYLNDRCRTFIGSVKTNGINCNPDDSLWDVMFYEHAQRWHFTSGLVSSAVYVYAGQPCTNVNIKQIQNNNSVIVCAMNIKVKGDVWTLEYNGHSINHSDSGNGITGIRVSPGGKVYAPPTDPVTGKELKDPIVVVYSNQYTAKDDLKTEGTH